jgi:zinc transporter ZupT
MSQLQAIIICVAIWLHSVLEGLSLGSATDASGLWTTFAAIAGHKALDGFAFAVGASVVESGSSKSRFASIRKKVFFSVNFDVRCLFIYAIPIPHYIFDT